MIRSFHKYEVKIIAKNFKTPNFEFKNTAQISFYNNENAIIKKIELAYTDNKAIENIFIKNNEINLDNCYIKEIDTKYIKGKTNKTILNFSAENCFFDSKNSIIDFSNIILKSNEILFNNSIFIADKIEFSNTIFNSKQVNFEYTYFKCKEISFQKSIFYKGDISFKNSKFTNGYKNFQEIQFNNGRKNFENIDFGNGDIDYTATNFANGKKSFKSSIFGTGKIDFSRVQFGIGETSFEKVYFDDGDISFRSAIFKEGKVNFISANFGNGKKHFINTDFGNGNVIFKNADFKNGKVSFRLAIFGEGIVDFHYSEFGNGDIIFDSTKFTNGGIDFKTVNFGTGKVSFRKAFLGNGNIIFEASKLKGIFIISNTVFGNGEFNFQDVYFENADLEIINVDFGLGKVTFNNSRFNILSLKESQLDNFFDLRLSKCNLLNLSNTVIKDIIDINPLGYTSTIKDFNFTEMRLLGRIYLDWKVNNVKEIIYNQQSTFKSKSEQFRMLKENYNLTGQYSYEDQAYVEFKRCEAKANLEIEKARGKLKRIKAHLKFWFEWLIFDKMGKYATDPLRVLITMGITYLIFTLTYILVAEFGDIHIISSLFDSNDPRVLNPYGRAFYHSAITFLTIGYGDYYPDGISRWISAIEGFTGLFQMSYFTVAFVRKVLR